MLFQSVRRAAGGVTCTRPVILLVLLCLAGTGCDAPRAQQAPEAFDWSAYGRDVYVVAFRSGR
jgi:hypothetical protein